jgi:RimJ/RimL family protein N-acetyltransferase
MVDLAGCGLLVACCGVHVVGVYSLARFGSGGVWNDLFGNAKIAIARLDGRRLGTVRTLECRWAGGWRLKKEAWGREYATEGAAACLRYGFSELGLDEVYSFTAEVNEPSRNVMKKIGMNFVKTFSHPRVDPGSPLSRHVLYLIHASQESLNKQMGDV